MDRTIRRSIGTSDGGRAIESPEIADVRQGEALDWKKLEEYLRANIASLDGEMTPFQFPGGSANLTYLLRFADTELVLRRPPFGVVAPGAHDMRREYRVLSRLWRVFDRAPRAYVFCDDHDVVGSDFVVMERRHGEVVRDELPTSMVGLPEVGRRLGFALSTPWPTCICSTRPMPDSLTSASRRASPPARSQGGDALGSGASRRRAAAHGRAAASDCPRRCRSRRGCRSCTTTSSSTTASSTRDNPTGLRRSSTGT